MLAQPCTMPTNATTSTNSTISTLATIPSIPSIAKCCNSTHAGSKKHMSAMLAPVINNVVQALRTQPSRYDSWARLALQHYLTRQPGASHTEQEKYLVQHHLDCCRQAITSPSYLNQPIVVYCCDSLDSWARTYNMPLDMQVRLRFLLGTTLTTFEQLARWVLSVK